MFAGLFDKKEKNFEADSSDKRAHLVVDVDAQGNESNARTYMSMPQKSYVDEKGSRTPFKSQENWHVSESGRERLLEVEERGRRYPIQPHPPPEETKPYTGGFLKGPDAFQGPSKVSQTRDAFRGFVENRVENLKHEEKMRRERDIYGRQVYEDMYKAQLPDALAQKAQYDIKKKYGIYSPEEQAKAAKQGGSFAINPSNVNKAMFGYDPNERAMKKKLVKRNGKWVEVLKESEEPKYKSNTMGNMMFGQEGSRGPFSQPQGGYGGGPGMFDFPQNIERNMEKELPRRKKQYGRETEPEEPREAPRSRGLYDF